MPAFSSPIAFEVRAYVPREHALWGWLGVPLANALLLRPSLGTAIAIASVLAGFGAVNAAARAARGSAAAGRAVLPAAIVAGVALCGAVACATSPGVVAVPLIAVGVTGMAATLAMRGRFVANQDVEVGIIAALAGLGVAIAVGNGAPVRAAVAVGAVVAAWHVIGLFWVNREFARVLPGRVSWRAGAVIAVACAAVGAVAAAWCSEPALALLIGLYPARIVAHSGAGAARDARRIGLTEFGWSLSIGAVAALLTRLT